MAPKEDVRGVLLENDRAADILRHYRKFEYATRDHTLLELLWHTGVRSGTIRGIDLDDIDEDAQAIHLRHRPDEETSLKNGKAGQRMVAINDSVFEVLQDYIRHHRLSKVDDYSREPLFSTRFGRISI